jgi:hypothetical protein
MIMVCNISLDPTQRAPLPETDRKTTLAPYTDLYRLLAILDSVLSVAYPREGFVRTFESARDSI